MAAAACTITSLPTIVPSSVRNCCTKGMLTAATTGTSASAMATGLSACIARVPAATPP